MRYIDPNQADSKVQFKSQYENFIGGQWVAPVRGEYFDNVSPVDGKVFTKYRVLLLKMLNLHLMQHTKQKLNGIKALQHYVQIFY
jgi:hypothetical protein